MKIILHIGRHKTGTTAIQRFLRKNHRLLEENGYYYPSFGVRGFGHHDIGASITRHSIKTSSEKPKDIIKGLRAGLDAELRECDLVVLFSSESFQNCDPKIVRKLFSADEVKIVVYLREQVGYLLSAYAQKVQATDYDGKLEDFCHENSRETYQDFLGNWEKAFPGAVCVKSYDKEQMISGNVVVDFSQSILGLDGKKVADLCCSTDANPSLTRDLLEYKLRINSGNLLSLKHSELLFKGLVALAVKDESGSVQISGDLVRFIEKRNEESNRYVAQKYFDREYLFKPFSQPVVYGSSGDLESRMSNIRKQLILNEPELDPLLPDILAAED